MKNPFGPRCQCGSRKYVYGFVQFPMAWAAACRNCGQSLFCALKVAGQKPAPPKQLPYDPYQDFGGGW